jgi:hypothetical protein
MEKDFDQLKQYIDESHIKIRSRGSLEDYEASDQVPWRYEWEENSNDFDFEDSDDYMRYDFNDLH